MSDKDAGTPRVFLVRHGETEWTISGRYTGTTDISLTPHGESQILTTANNLVGSGKLIDPSKLSHIYISPRTRAQRTYELMFSSTQNPTFKAETAPEIAEWNYGAYEGLLTSEIRAHRKAANLDSDPTTPWNIWRDGCAAAGGESPSNITARLDFLIDKIRQIQAPYMHGEGAADVVVFGHGHSLRAFAKRWIGFEMKDRLPLMLEPGAVGVLSYEHHSVEEPALLLGVNLGGK